MVLSEATLNVLKNFAKINPSLLIKAGNELSTLSIGRNVIAYATVEESFPVTCGIYDLNQFLGMFSMYENPSLDFQEKQVVISQEGTPYKSTFVYGEESTIVYPVNAPNFPEVTEINFSLPANDLQKILKAATVMNLENIIVQDDHIFAANIAVDSSNSYLVNFDNSRCTGTYKMISKREYWHGILEGDYEVSMSSKGIAHFKAETAGLSYEIWIALEKESTFTG